MPSNLPVNVTPEQARQILHAGQVELDRRSCVSLAEFAKRSWHILEPTTPLTWGKPLDVMCEVLEEIFYNPGFQPRKLANVPPGPGWVENMVNTNRGRKRLGDIVPGDMVLTHKGRYRRVTDCYSKGMLPVLKIVTNSGREMHLTPDHNCLTPDGWVEAGNLKVGEILAVVTPIEDREKIISNEEARFIGYLIGDGSISGKITQFINNDEDIICDFIHCANSLGFETTRSYRTSHSVITVKGGEKVRDWRKRHGICGTNSYTKFIPDAVINSSKETIRNFIGAYWSCDGGFDVRQSMTRGSRFRAYGTTVSERLAKDLLHALSQIGIRARLRRKARKLDTLAQPGGVYRSFSVEVQNEADTSRFIDMPGLCARKNEAVKGCILRRFDSVLSEDEIIAIEHDGFRECACISVEEDHSLTWDDLVVHNSMKSLLWSVIFPAWVWSLDPTKSFTGVAHEQGLAIRDARKMRMLVESEWYQARWPLAMASDANAKTYFENEYRGFRQAVPFRSMTGRRSDFVIVDDPHSAEDANSPAYREETKRIFRETLPTRVNNDQSAILIIMQRLHEDDISGIILAEPGHFGYDTLILPMRYESERPDPRDWRVTDGELFFPERFSERSVEALEATLGSYGAASQLQQRPVPREGGMFKAAWFDGKYVTSVPPGTRFKRWWDLAATKDKNAARTAGVLLGRTPQGRYIICHSAMCQEEPYRRNEFIRAQCESDVAQYGKGVEFYVPIDPGAGGKETAMSLVQFLDGFNVRSRKEVGDKESRAEPFSAACEGGNVDILSGDWNKAFLDELTIFPGGKWKDQVDSVVNAHARFVAEPVKKYSFAGAVVLDIAP